MDIQAIIRVESNGPGYEVLFYYLLVLMFTVKTKTKYNLLSPLHRLLST